MNFDYQISNSSRAMPLLPVRLHLGQSNTVGLALVDSGASVNVLPHSLGQGLGLDWRTSAKGPSLSGNASGETRVIEVMVEITGFEFIKLAFCWLEHDRTRLVFGKENFFDLFHVCFFADRQEFSINSLEVK
jgi:hypothetical protein